MSYRFPCCPAWLSSTVRIKPQGWAWWHTSFQHLRQSHLDVCKFQAGLTYTWSVDNSCLRESLAKLTTRTWREAPGSRAWESQQEHDRENRLHSTRALRGAARGLTHPLTGMLAARAACMTPSKRWKLSSIEQFTFFRVKSSDAAPKMLTSLAPAATCQHPVKTFSTLLLEKLLR